MTSKGDELNREQSGNYLHIEGRRSLKREEEAVKWGADGVLEWQKGQWVVDTEVDEEED